MGGPGVGVGGSVERRKREVSVLNGKTDLKSLLLPDPSLFFADGINFKIFGGPHCSFLSLLAVKLQFASQVSLF